MKLSKRSYAIETSLTRTLFNEAAAYDDCIDLTLGDPSFDTPDEIKKAGINAILNNNTHYSANAGLTEAREAVAKRVEKIWNVKCDAESNVIITVGGMEAIYLALLSLVDSSDEVIVFAPYYVNYLQMVRMCGGTPVVIDCYDSKNGIKIQKDLLESKITDKTVAIIINTPNNPSGGIIDKKSLEAIADVADKYDIAVISDEVYRTLLFDGNVHQSILQFEKAKNRTILIDSLSKEFSMTGWRVGYSYAPADIISAMVKFQENVAACVTVPSQYAAIEAYTNKINTMHFTKYFQERRDCLCEAFANIKGIKFVKPQGTFYMFIDISQLYIDSETFAYKLLREKHVAVVPGKTYGDGYDNYIRIAFVKDIRTLKDAAERIKALINEL